MKMPRVAGRLAGALLSAVALLLAQAVHADVLKPDSSNKIYYNNYENVFDASGRLKAPGAGLAAGDHIAGIINVQNIDADGQTIFYAGFQNQLTGIFAQRVLAILGPPDPFDVDQTDEPHVVLGPPAVSHFCSGADCFDTGLTGNEMMALHLQTGAGTTVFEANGSMADDVAKATDGPLWLTLGHGAGADGQFGTADDEGYVYSHTDGNFPPPDHGFAALDAIINNTGYAFAGLNDINENEVGGQNLLFNDVVLTSELQLNEDAQLGFSPWLVQSNDPAIVHPFEITEGAACRVTGGGVDTFVTSEGLAVDLWDGTFEQGGMGGERYQFGGQAGAHTAQPPQPAGEWTHHQQSGNFGSFTFHGGTASAPQGTEIAAIRCSDAGFCKPARPAPAKQIDFDGIGTFKNIGKGARSAPHWLIPGAHVTAEGKGNKAFNGTFHWFEVNIDDLGEPGNENSDQNPGAGDSARCPIDGFGEKAATALANCDCPDFYRITIYDGVRAANVVWDAAGNIDPNSLNRTDVIYEVWGYIDGGNLQIHPPTGFDLK